MDSASSRSSGPSDAAILRRIITGLSGAVGEAYFDHLSSALADALSADVVFTGQVLTESNSIQTVSLFSDGQRANDLVYCLNDTPCLDVIGRNTTVVHPSDLQGLHPKDDLLKELGLESYAGTPLRDSDGKPLGHLVAFWRRPLTDTEQVRDILELFAMRAASELQRVRMDAVLKAEIEERRAAQARAEAAVLAKSQFLANLSHEFRTPLNGIIGVADIICNEVFGPLSDSRYCQYASEIRTSGLHLLRLFEDLLDVSAGELGGIKLTEETLSLPEFIQAGMLIASSRATAKDIETELDVPDDTPGLRADRTRMIQIIVNLLTNSYKFSDAGSRVEVKVGPLDDGGIEIGVRDHGIGMAPEDIPRALQPFEQIRGDVTNTHGGTGLGLALVAQLMGLHGGSIDIVSALGEGTTVYLRFPPERTVRDPATSRHAEDRAVGS